MMELPDFEQYAAELKKLEDYPPAAIELPPLATIALITHVQLATRHPELANDKGLTKVAIDVAIQLQALFNPESTVYKVLELGWNPDADLPRISPSSGLSWAAFFATDDDDDDDDYGREPLDDIRPCHQDYEDDDDDYNPLEDADDLWSSNHDGFFDNVYGKPATVVNDDID